MKALLETKEEFATVLALEKVLKDEQPIGKRFRVSSDGPSKQDCGSCER